jgi:hypothetical protein
MMNHKLVRSALIVVETFVALSAVAGGIALLREVFAQGKPVVWLAGTPFNDYTIPGLLLALVIGGGMLLAAATVFIPREWAVLISVGAGIVMVGFEVVEAVCIDSNVGDGLPLVAGLQVFYVVLGLAIFGLAASLWMTEYRGHSLLTRHISHA